MLPVLFNCCHWLASYGNIWGLLEWTFCQPHVIAGTQVHVLKQWRIITLWNNEEYDVILSSLCNSDVIIVWQRVQGDQLYGKPGNVTIWAVVEMSGIWQKKIWEMSEEDVVGEDYLWFFMFGATLVFSSGVMLQ